MKALKSRTLSLVTALMLVLSLFALLPQGMLRADALGNISGMGRDTTSKYLYWDSYSGASYYKVEVTSSKLNKSYKVTDCKFEFGDIFTQKGVMYYYSVTAYSIGGTALTRPAKDFYVDQAKITGVKLGKDYILTWDKVNADYEKIGVNVTTPTGGVGGVGTITDTSANIMDHLENLPSGTYELWVDASVDVGYHQTTAKSDHLTFEYTSHNSFITTTDVKINKPVSGKKPADTVNSIVLNGGELDVNKCVETVSVSWRNSYNELLSDDDVFEEGKTYTAWVTVYLKAGCYMDYETWINKDETSSINGKKTRMYNLGGLTAYDMEATFTARIPDTVNITVPEPKAGEIITNNQDVISVTPSDSGVKVYDNGRRKNKVTWSDPPYMIQWGVTEFKNGKTYTLKFKLAQTYAVGEPAPDFELNEDTVVNVNGKRAEFTGKDGFYYTYQLKFTVGGLKGDVDGNGVINMKDLATLQRYVNGWDVTINEANSDLDNSGSINMKDVAALQRLINSL